MWYFAWMLGVTMAVLLAVVNTMMYDARDCARQREGREENRA